MHPKQPKFDFNDILISPAIITDISTRKQVNSLYEDGYLPIFTAPMDTVVSSENKDFFFRNGIKVIIPRTEKLGNVIETSHDLFRSVGMDEFESIFLGENSIEGGPFYILIDIANGHMSKLLDITRRAKKTYGDSLILMVGNVAHPETYREFSSVGADYIRIGIGNGAGCLTTVQTGVGYPMASLIKECYEVSCSLDNPAKIVADGGFKDYSDIIKALALGADYVMLGSILNKALESSGETYLSNRSINYDSRVNQYSVDTENLFKNGVKMFKLFRGMSTKEAQIAMGKTVLKTSEGVTRMQPVEYTISGWADNFKSYLSSAMSYSNATTLDQFIGKAEWNMITANSYERFKK
jgi:IMP dehydrogenase/GMP reductase